MNFPAWDVPLLGGGMLIAIVAILHVFVAHFAVGGGLFLVWSEARAYRTRDDDLLRYVRAHSTFFVWRATPGFTPISATRGCGHGSRTCWWPRSR
jgi:hypothetical protein